MAVYRNIHISFWQDSFILKLNTIEKFFYLYLMTNSKTAQCGIYELPIPIITFETGLKVEEIEGLIRDFETKYKKIKYNFENQEVIILNWLKHNPINNQNICKCVLSEIENVKTIDFTDIIDPIVRDYEGACDTLPSKKNKNKNNNKNNQNNNQKQQKQIKGANVSTPLNENVAVVVDFYNNNIGMITGYGLEVLTSYLDDGMETEVIIFAMKQAIEQR